MSKPGIIALILAIAALLVCVYNARMLRRNRRTLEARERLFIAPVGTEPGGFEDGTGGWQEVGSIVPGSLKFTETEHERDETGRWVKQPGADGCVAGGPAGVPPKRPTGSVSPDGSGTFPGLLTPAPGVYSPTQGQDPAPAHETPCEPAADRYNPPDPSPSYDPPASHDSGSSSSYDSGSSYSDGGSSSSDGGGGGGGCD